MCDVDDAIVFKMLALSERKDVEDYALWNVVIGKSLVVYDSALRVIDVKHFCVFYFSFWHF